MPKCLWAAAGRFFLLAGTITSSSNATIGIQVVSKIRCASWLLLLAIPAQLASHWALVSLPYFWDEAGYYVPAAHDFYARHLLIPETIPSNAHPPLLSLYVSAIWWAFGEHIETARIGMLFLSAIGLWAIFRLGSVLSSPRTGLLALICTAAYPLFFAQSSMILADLPSAAFSILGLSYYFEGRKRAGLWFAVAALFKETAIITPLSLLLVDVAVLYRAHSLNKPPGAVRLRNHIAWTAMPTTLLVGWYAYHWRLTGFVFGNEEFLQYNVLQTATLSRFFVAFPMRLWQAFGHLGLILLSLCACISILATGLRGLRAVGRTLTGPAALRVSILVGSHLMAFSFLGGALLTRYLLPIVPLIILAALVSLRRREIVTLIATPWFIVNLFANPPYHFPAEENLAYRDFVRVHQAAATFLEREHPTFKIATAWPATFQLSMPCLGYVKQPLPIVAVDRLDRQSLRQVSEQGREIDVVLLFNREYSPPDSWLRPGRLLGRLKWWQRSRAWLDGSSTDESKGLVLVGDAETYRRWTQGPFHATLLRFADMNSQ
jgi:hypothetical protein